MRRIATIFLFFSLLIGWYGAWQFSPSVYERRVDYDLNQGRQAEWPEFVQANLEDELRRLRDDRQLQARNFVMYSAPLFLLFLFGSWAVVCARARRSSPVYDPTWFSMSFKPAPVPSRRVLGPDAMRERVELARKTLRPMPERLFGERAHKEK